MLTAARFAMCEQMYNRVSNKCKHMNTLSAALKFATANYTPGQKRAASAVSTVARREARTNKRSRASTAGASSQGVNSSESTARTTNNPVNYVDGIELDDLTFDDAIVNEINSTCAGSSASVQKKHKDVEVSNNTRPPPRAMNVQASSGRASSTEEGEHRA